jgi:hypothetical protein
VTPWRALIVSADIGEGHNSAGRALEEAIARVWPGCQVRWLDALAALGRGSPIWPGAFMQGGITIKFVIPRAATGGCAASRAVSK